MYKRQGSTYEGGIREPMIVSWPGVVKPGSKCDNYLLIEDFYPSILEMAGIKKMCIRDRNDVHSSVCQ